MTIRSGILVALLLVLTIAALLSLLGLETILRADRHLSNSVEMIAPRAQGLRDIRTTLTTLRETLLSKPEPMSADWEVGGRSLELIASAQTAVRDLDEYWGEGRPLVSIGNLSSLKESLTRLNVQSLKYTSDSARGLVEYGSLVRDVEQARQEADALLLAALLRPLDNGKTVNQVTTTYRRGYEAKVVHVLFASLLLIGALTTLIVKRIMGPIGGLCRALDALAAGDFRTRVSVPARSEFSRSAVAFNRMAEMLEERDELLTARMTAEDENRQKSELITKFSHDIKTPLTTILGFADLIAETLPMPPLQDYALTIRHSGQCLLSAVNDVLDVSSLKTGKARFLLLSQSLPELLREVHSLMRMRASRRGLEFRVFSDGPVPEYLRTDALRFRQILTSLVDNAIKYTHEGFVHLLARVESDETSTELHLEVRDTGVGIPEACCHSFRSSAQESHRVAIEIGETESGLEFCNRTTSLLGGRLRVIRTEPSWGTLVAASFPFESDADSVEFDFGEQSPIIGDVVDQADSMVGTCTF